MAWAKFCIFWCSCSHLFLMPWWWNKQNVMFVQIVNYCSYNQCLYNHCLYNRPNTTNKTADIWVQINEIDTISVDQASHTRWSQNNIVENSLPSQSTRLISLSFWCLRPLSCPAGTNLPVRFEAHNLSIWCNHGCNIARQFILWILQARGFTQIGYTHLNPSMMHLS